MCNFQKHLFFFPPLLVRLNLVFSTYLGDKHSYCSLLVQILHAPPFRQQVVTVSLEDRFISQGMD